MDVIFLRKAENHWNGKKRNRYLNPWPFIANFVEPIYWFWASIEWYTSEATIDPEDDVNTTSFAELMIAFQLGQPMYGEALQSRKDNPVPKSEPIQF